MQKDNENEEQNENTEYDEPVKFGYGASIFFLIFIGFVIYASLGR